jgi:nucleoside-diphosphate-sugar epimerase
VLVETSLIARCDPALGGHLEHGDSGLSAEARGGNRWPAVHLLDAADLVSRAVQRAPAGSVLHATAEDGIATRDIAAALGRQLDVPVRSIPAGEAAPLFGFLGDFFGMDAPASSTLTRELLDWQPTQAGLIADIDAGSYTPA